MILTDFEVIDGDFSPQVSCSREVESNLETDLPSQPIKLTSLTNSFGFVQTVYCFEGKMTATIGLRLIRINLLALFSLCDSLKVQIIEKFVFYPIISRGSVLCFGFFCFSKP